ncbi:MAG: hypothetical protein Kow0092_10280 [Deferrisomatales bacterium]
MDVRAKKWLVFIVSVFFLGALLLVARNESVRFARRVGLEPKKIHVSEASRPCLECHKRKGVAPGSLAQWEGSLHATKGIDCVQCHSAEKGEFDAFQCPQSDVVVARHPTPQDCAKCHKEEVQQFTESKHAYPFWLYANADRAVFEPTVMTHNGCEECHNITNLWPDGSVGECDACHPKHSFSVAVARQPETCGECHIGPDHPHIELYLESKHGNIFKTHSKDWDLSYKSSDTEPIPIEVPTCTTCHMDAVPGVKATHNVSARLAWESQAPWSFRTVWQEEKLGSWQDKRTRMKGVCLNCHAGSFVDMYLLTADLVNLQYNEMRRQFVYWTKKYTDNGLIRRTQAGEKFLSNPAVNGWDETPERLMYYGWHHEGRRVRHGAQMMGADYTQWHGIWEVQTLLMELIEWGAEHGDAEARKIWEADSPAKFMTYKIYDVPGNAWGIGLETFKTPVLYELVPNYWEQVKANVEAAYRRGLLSDDQWALWSERYENRDHYLGTRYGSHPVFEASKKHLSRDKAALQEQILELELPSPPRSP